MELASAQELLWDLEKWLENPARGSGWLRVKWAAGLRWAGGHCGVKACPGACPIDVNRAQVLAAKMTAAKAETRDWDRRERVGKRGKRSPERSRRRGQQTSQAAAASLQVLIDKEIYGSQKYFSIIKILFIHQKANLIKEFYKPQPAWS